MPTKLATQYLCRSLFSLVVVPVAAHLVNPRLYSLFAARERTSNPDKLLERVHFLTGWPDHGSVLFDDKLDAIAGLQAQALANFLRHRKLAFAADCAKVAHIYHDSLLDRKS